MKVLIISIYLFGIVYQILFMDVIKIFANSAVTSFEEAMENFPMHRTQFKQIKLVVNLVTFTGMIFVICIWPIMLLYELYLRIMINVRLFLFWREIKKLRKMIERTKLEIKRDL